MTAYLASLMVFAGINVLLALGLNVVWGLGGMINLGLAGFFAAVAIGFGLYAALLVLAVVRVKAPDSANT